MEIIKAADGWGHRSPFNWQVRTYGKILDHYGQPMPKPGLVHAVTGGGKSAVMAQTLASCRLNFASEVIVVTTSTISLVEQLQATIGERLEPPGFALKGRPKVGTFYTHGKDTHTPVIITCMPSLPDLAEVLKQKNRKVGLWLCDEAHRFATETIVEAVKMLDPTWRLAFTATPFRSSGKERLTLFEHLIDTYGPTEALADGVVVPYRTVSWDGGDASLDDACISMTRLAIGPGLYNATCIDDAELFCIKLEKEGMKAKSIHSKLSRAECRARVEELRTGKLFALVHVAMLQEGVDWPWLRWLCMRRCIGSRLRYVQEIGRVLRAVFEPGTNIPAKNPDGSLVKPEAVLYDPHGLVDEFNLTYDAVLGGEFMPPEDVKEKESERVKKFLEQQVFECMEEMLAVQAGKKPLSVKPLISYMRELVSVFDLCGLIDRKIVSRHWRKMLSTQKQHTAIKNMKWSTQLKPVPKLHKHALEMLTEYGPAMTRGNCADFLDVLMSIAAKRKWPDYKILDRSVEENLEKTEKPQLLPNVTMEQRRAPVQKPKPIIQPELFDGIE
jgi:hypothetical protein